jgi:mono/diheme cytochrome c family protein
LTEVNEAGGKNGDQEYLTGVNQMKRKYLLLGLVISATMLVAVRAVAATTADTAAKGTSPITVELGKEDFRDYCASCHGVSGRGDGTVAEFLTISAADLTQLSKLNSGKFPRERVTEVIDGRADVKVHGGRDMPVWGDWFDAEAVDADTDAAAREVIVRERINALADYIETLQEK